MPGFYFANARGWLAALALLFVLVIFLYIPGLPGGFIFDDNINILENNSLRVVNFDVEKLIYAALSFRDGNGSRPLPMLSFAIDHWLAGGFDTTAFKKTNIAIHGLVFIAIAFFLRRVLIIANWSVQSAAWGAMFLALAWAIHSLQVSSVLYVVQRMQTMSVLFTVLALWAYVAMRQAQLAGKRGRRQGLLVVLAWLLALGCKEDAVLLPVYTLMLELTVLRFAAAQKEVERGLRQSYALMVVAALAFFAFYVVPHYWSWEPYEWRDFTSMERLLTQARVLVMYLCQMVFPWPDFMPFNYDDYPVSRSLLQPWTTLPALLLLAGLLIWAVRWRNERPLFAFGVLFFFSGHLITSNIVGLELVFEHRNYLPLLGVILAVADLLIMAVKHLKLNPATIAIFFGLILVWLGGTTLVRSHTWGDPVRLGEKLSTLSPNSYRPWVEWSSAWFNLYSETHDKRYLQHAIEVSEQSLKHVDYYIISGNIILYKSLQGSLTDDDWQRYYYSLRNTLPAWRRNQIMQWLVVNVGNGHITDKQGVMRSLMVLIEIEKIDFISAMKMGVLSYKLDVPIVAIFFFKIAAQLATREETSFSTLLTELAKAGHDEWVGELQEIHKKSLLEK